MCWKWSFSKENGRKSNIIRIKYPLNIFLHNIASWYWQISTHKVAKIQLLGTIIVYIKYKRIQGVENDVLAPKTIENQRLYGWNIL